MATFALAINVKYDCPYINFAKPFSFFKHGNRRLLFFLGLLMLLHSTKWFYKAFFES